MVYNHSLVLLAILVAQLGTFECSTSGGCSIPTPKEVIEKANRLYEKHRQKSQKHSRIELDDLPSFFDARKHPAFSNCKDIISKVHDQSKCGACYAVATAAAITDRICIATKGKIKDPISAADFIDCCTDCHAVVGGVKMDGCIAGKAFEAWKYWHTNGVVTGGEHGPYWHGSMCKPYPYPKCNDNMVKVVYSGCKDGNRFTGGTCKKQCQPSYKKRKYENDKYYGGLPHCYTTLNPETNSHTKSVDNELYIKRSLYMDGSMTARMDAYEDLRKRYQKGTIYRRSDDPGDADGHVVKLIGWGEEMENDQKVKYWLAMSSWGPGWGDNGVFKIEMGTRWIYFETEICAAEFDSTRLPQN